MRQALLLLLVAAGMTLVSSANASTARGTAPGADAALGRAIDAYAKPLLDRGDLSGQLLVARNGKIVVERSFGMANVELGVPVTPETRFNVASVTKPMTMLIALRLLEQKRIASNDSIAKWIPDFPKGDRIRISTLLRHRSGIPHELVPDSEAVRPRTAEEMVERAKKRALDFEPGDHESYSSGGYTVLARVLELASGKTYEQLLNEYLVQPLQMTHTTNSNSVELLPGRASCYLPGANGVENAAFQDFSGLAGAGSVWSTARDLHAFVQATVTGTLGSEYREAFVRHGKLDFNGSTSGFRAFATWDSTGLEVIFCGNLMSGTGDLLKNAVPALAAGEKVAAPELPALATSAPDAASLRHCEGAYLLGNGTKLDVRAKDGHLWANDWILKPMRDGGFFSPRDYGLVRFVDGADGRTTRLDWTQNGQVYPAPRVGE